jgi:GNAT superfamily N-acetyltransferase
MLIIRNYLEENDAYPVGRLISDTWSELNQTFAPTEERDYDWEPFQHARSLETRHRAEIARLIRAEKVYVAEGEEGIAGVLRGCAAANGRLLSLYVRGNYQWPDVGRKLVERFEQDCLWEGVRQVRLAAKIYAVPFYLKLGYRRSTGIRASFGFEGRGLIYQPMKKEIWKR